MRAAWVQSKVALQERMTAHRQIGAPVADANMPPYMDSFLGHLRLLVGVPFDYLVPDARLLPTESVRFFYIDRSWTDRLVDGALAVGKIGSREQAHHQANAPQVIQQLDLTERQVRNLQRGRLAFEVARANPIGGAADVVTGFVMRSRAVSGWPHMDVRAYSVGATKPGTSGPAGSGGLPPGFDPADPAVQAKQLRTLRLERLAPAVMLALFEGIPRMVMCEEPHHGIQFGVHDENGELYVLRRNAQGVVIQPPPSAKLKVPLRPGGKRVVHVAAMRQGLIDAAAQPVAPAKGAMPVQNGSGAFAIEMLKLPWRQRFEGEGGQPEKRGTGRYVSEFKVIAKALDPQVKLVMGKVGK